MQPGEAHGLRLIGHRHLRLVCGAVLPRCGSERGDLPFAVLLGEIEEIPAAVIELAVYIEVKRCPDDGQVVVDAVPEVAMRLATFSMVIWLRTPSRTSTRTPPGNQGALIAAASRWAMPSNMACIGARTAISSCFREQPQIRPRAKQTITACRRDRMGTAPDRSVAESRPEFIEERVCDSIPARRSASAKSFEP
jgi:hypothetical protein